MHGGDIYRNPVTLDFSVNVNPLGVPEQVKRALTEGIRQISAYPDPICEELRKRIAKHFGRMPEEVLCGNGASELLTAICRWKKWENALLMAPGFSGYEKALRASGCEIIYFLLREDEGFGLPEERFEQLCKMIADEKIQLMFLANPSNPVGRLIPKRMLRELAKLCERTKTTIVLDECFLELTDEPQKYSMTDILEQYPGIIVLRAFTKSFAMPGVRLGYLLCTNKESVTGIAAQLPEWNVSLPAQLAGEAAMAVWEENDYLLESRKVILLERDFLMSELKKRGACVYPSSANFILFRWKDALLSEQLLKRGILIRDCRDYEGLEPGCYRIAVRSHEENCELLKNMSDL